MQVLQSFKIMDYSLLVAIHKVEETGRPRVKRSFSEPSTDSPSGLMPPPPDGAQSPSNGQQATSSTGKARIHTLHIH